MRCPESGWDRKTLTEEIPQKEIPPEQPLRPEAEHKSCHKTLDEAALAAQEACQHGHVVAAVDAAHQPLLVPVEPLDDLIDGVTEAVLNFIRVFLLFAGVGADKAVGHRSGRRVRRLVDYVRRLVGEAAEVAALVVHWVGGGSNKLTDQHPFHRPIVHASSKPTIARELVSMTGDLISYPNAVEMQLR